MREHRSETFPNPGPSRLALLLPALLLPALIPACHSEAAPGGADRGQALFKTCVPCHGPHADGRRDLGAPALAGQTFWYLRDQLQNFRKAWRGTHPEDVEGLRMRPMARTLESDADVEAVAKYIAAMPPVRVAPTVSGDPEKGKTYYVTCIQCHGDKAQGIESQKAPALNMTGDWYQLAQLKKYKAGIRGSESQNAFGTLMRGMVLGLPDEQAMRDVVAYIQTLSNQGGDN